MSLFEKDLLLVKNNKDKKELSNSLYDIDTNGKKYFYEIRK